MTVSEIRPKPQDASPLLPLSDVLQEQASGIFLSAWAGIEQRVLSGAARLPREIIWLGGAPGAGKGTNTPFISRERGITAPPIVTSSLLNDPLMQQIKNSGRLVGDADVVRLLFERLLDPVNTNGVLVDGFPRTRVQVECVKLLYQRMHDLRSSHRGTPLAALFPKPMFHIVILYVEEKESVARQLRRGREIVAQNERVRETGVGVLQEERVTDLSEESSRKRYRVFMEQTYPVLQSLRQVFHFHVINAQGDLASVERAINSEFQYQSSLELDEDTFDAIHHIPVVSELVVAARQHLVQRLERYTRDHSALFLRVIAFIDEEVVPTILMHAMTGLAKLNSDNELFADPLAMSMLVDVLSERGYRACATVDARDVPVRIDPATNYVICMRRPRYRFEFQFQGSQIRRGPV